MCVRRRARMAGLRLMQFPDRFWARRGRALTVTLAPGYAIVLAPDAPGASVFQAGHREPCHGSSANNERTTMTGRSMAMIGFVLLALGAPVLAQAPTPADREAWGNDQAKPSELAPPAAGQSTPLPPRIAPPARADDEFDPPPSPGCQYRENKLDLVV